MAAAAAGGFLIGSVGLASAGSLPAPAQDAARSALSTVGINVPPGHDRYNDPTKCPGGPYANHGAYVRAHPNDPNAGASPCGKPNKAVKQAGNGATPGAPEDNGNDNGNGGRHGPPPWAHGNLKGRFKFRVLSPKTPPPDGNQAGFNGDYNDIVVTPDGRAHPTWSDTRVRVPDPGFYGSSVDEDMYTTSKSIR